MFNVNYLHIADSAREVENFRLREVFRTEPVSLRIFFVLFPDNRRLQTFFNCRPYGESKVRIRISIIVAVSYVYLVNLVKEVFFRVFRENIRHGGLYSGAAQSNLTRSFPFFLLRELIISQFDVRQFIGFLRMLRTQCQSAVQIPDSNLEACVENRRVHPRVTCVHGKRNAMFFYDFFNAFGIHRIDLFWDKFSSAADFISDFLCPFKVIIGNNYFFRPVCFRASSFYNFCRRGANSACSDNQ